MLIKRIYQTITSALRAWLVACLVLGSLLAALFTSASSVQSANVLAVQADMDALVGDDFSASAIVSTYNHGQQYFGNLSLEALSDYIIYLPMVLKNFPVLPNAPVLNAISNGDGDGNYTVSWSSSEEAQTYSLQEDDNATFSTPTTVYSGSSTSTAISGRDMGTYYYRVGASNTYGSSGWSNVKSVEVTVPLPNCPQAGDWSGTTYQGRSIVFTVEDTPSCKITYGSMKINYRDSCAVTLTVTWNSEISITNNHFQIGTTNYVIGDFTSPTSAQGTFRESRPEPGYPGFYCTASGSWTANLLP